MAASHHVCGIHRCDSHNVCQGKVVEVEATEHAEMGT